MFSSKYGCSYCRLLSFPFHVDQSDSLEKDDVYDDMLDRLHETDNLKVPMMVICDAAVEVAVFVFRTLLERKSSQLASF